MKAQWLTRLAAAFGAAALLSCSSHHNAGSPGAAGTGEPPAGGDDASDVAGDDASGPATTALNPDGIAYPSGPYGRTARSGNTHGRIIQNFTFLGYPNGVVGGDLQRVSLADYYDPCKKRYNLIHLNVAAVWCTPCNQETGAMAANADWLNSQGIVVLQALDDGVVQGVGATVSDLQMWIGKYKPTFTEMLDPDPNPQLGGFFDAAAVPWNADIDPRTMEIIDSGTGWSGDVQSTMAVGLEAVSQPPNYPLPTCQ